jgi:hypothetical protein
MGEKRRTKSKGKTVKPGNGRRPHELREQQGAVKAPVTTGPVPDRSSSKG